MGIGNNIRELRTRNNMSQETLAELLGVTRTAVTHWESGVFTPRMGNIEKMAHIFGVRKSEIVDAEPEPQMLSDDEMHVIELWRKMDKSARSIVLASMVAAVGG